MRSSLDELLGIDPQDPLDSLAEDLVQADSRLLDDLIAARQAARLSQAQVADRMGISQSAVARIESGERNPQLSTLRRYAHAVRARVEHRVIPDATGAVHELVAPYENPSSAS